MFIAAMSTVAKLGKEPRCLSTDDRCLSTDEWIKKMSFIYTIDYYIAIRKNEYLPFTSIWMELEGIMLSQISQAEKDIVSFICDT